jgi:DNA-binding Lrp family transcriptional regulator
LVEGQSERRKSNSYPNSCRSDRKLSKAIGTSQHTMTRLKQRLEREGTIKEYTIMPDFRKFRYHIMAFVFARLEKIPNPEIVKKAMRTFTTESPS